MKSKFSIMPPLQKRLLSTGTYDISTKMLFEDLEKNGPFLQHFPNKHALERKVWYYEQQKVLENNEALFVKQNGIFAENVFEVGRQNWFPKLAEISWHYSYIQICR